MTSASVALVRSFIAAFQRGDLEALADTLDPAVELREWPEGPEARTYHGHDGARAAIAAWFESWERIDVEIEDVVDTGDRVAVTLRQRYQGRGSELETEITSTNVFTVRDAKIVRVELFTDRAASSTKVAAVRRFVDAFNRLDLDTVFADLHPEVELHEWPEAPGARTYRGSEGVQAALDSWFETWAWMRVQIEDIVEADEHVLFTLHQRARGKGSEAEVEIRSFNVYTFRNGKVIGIRLFLEREAALAAAGIVPDQEQEVRP